MSFDLALARVLAEEGGFADVAADPGGPTMRGVTQANYDAWRDKHGAPRRPVSESTIDEATRFYSEEYWAPSGGEPCDRLGKDKLALLTFDWGVNAGVGRAARYLQLVVGATVDGHIGPRTEAAIDGCDELAACGEYLIWRAKHYWARAARSTAFIRELKEARLMPPAPDIEARAFLNGWLGRLRRLAQQCGLEPHVLYAKGAHLRETPPT